MSSEIKQCQNCEKEFVIEPEDFLFYEKIKVPAPTFCPECRLQRRYAWRNVRTIYKRKCDLCGKDAIGVYSQNKPFVVYCSKCWWGDSWDGLKYGKDYDFSRTFFEQFSDLLKEAPLVNRFSYEDTLLRSDYTNMTMGLKDCYLVFHSDYGERCYYSDELVQCYDCMDVSYVSHSQLCYDSLNLNKCSKVYFSEDCESCLDSYFLKSCIGCSNCFGCAHLRNKQHHIFNKPYSKDDYFQKLKELGFSSHSYMSVAHFKHLIKNFWLKFPVKFIHGSHNSDVSGDYIYYSKRTIHSFHMRESEDVKFCAYLQVPGAKDSYDWSQYGDKGELMYEILQGGGGTYNNKFGWCIWRGARNTEYGILNVNCADCFGCVSLRNKQYCILNKQYSEEQYKALREKIITQMNATPYQDKQGRIYRYGEFFPVKLSPFGYNETFAQEEFYLAKEEILQKGYIWEDIEQHRGKYEITRDSIELPDDINNVKDEILNEVFRCEKCGKPYNIVQQELDFYRNQNLPLPHKCYECRYQNRIENKNFSKLWHRKCQCSGLKSGEGGSTKSETFSYTNTIAHFHGQNPCLNTFQTTYASDRQEIVYCEKCYQAEVV